MSSETKFLAGFLVIGIILLSGCVEKPDVTTTTLIPTTTITPHVTTSTLISEKQVSISSDKMEYDPGEEIEITIENRLGEVILFGFLSGCSGEAYIIQKLEANGWIDLRTVCGPCRYVIRDKIQLNSYKTYHWSQQVYADFLNCSSLTKVSPGLYRVKIEYRGGIDTTPRKEAYSNEFMIKEERSDEYRIYLGSRQFIPTPGISSTLKSRLRNISGEQAHVLLQFYDIPDNNNRRELSNLNVILCDYVHNNTYFASIPTRYLTEIYNLSFIRWIGDIPPEDKISQIIRENRIPPEAISPEGDVNLSILFFRDVSLDGASQLISDYGGVVNGRAMNILVVTVPMELISTIADEDSVQWINIVPGQPVTL